MCTVIKRNAKKELKNLASQYMAIAVIDPRQSVINTIPVKLSLITTPLLLLKIYIFAHQFHILCAVSAASLKKTKTTVH